ncbi:MAG: hypothetical protein ACTSV1_01300 [Alphaproteobacteria bacterium]
MTSPAQIAANRLNALKSTGPKTPRGQSHARFNALRHGLYARDVVLPGEDRAAFDDMLASLTADLAPDGHIEDGLVERLAQLWWRLGRTAAIEAGLLNPDWDGDANDTGGGPLIDTFRVAIDQTPTLDQLGRYEGRLERAFARSLNLLQRLQSARRRNTPEPGP